MRIASLHIEKQPVIGVRDGDGYRDVTSVDAGLGTDVGQLIQGGPEWRHRVEAALPHAALLPAGAVRFRPLVPRPGKLLCLGLNDRDHAAEGGFEVPTFPAVFGRVSSSLIGHGEPMLRPPESEQLDYECELAVVLGKGGRRIAEADALSHVAGYTVFNDGTVREYQRMTSQWTLGKNFHGTGAMGPELVTADELPAGAHGLRMTTRVGDELLQNGDTGSMIFGVAKTLHLLSIAVAFEPGDVIAFGTPAGVGHARRPPRWLLPGEICEVAIERIGTLRNPVRDDSTAS
ncbi:MAG: fumarylacetoacetate hydrolase family protein [Myxococcales bacterium]|nr:fumarylacetoacetate hydrolase family protein [Myxococcales bacterium]